MQPRSARWWAMAKTKLRTAKTAKDFEAEEEAGEIEVVAANTGDTYYYCLEENHPGSPAFQASPVDSGRIFTSASQGCPECPSCNRQVSAALCDVVKGEPVPPQLVFDLVARNSGG